MFSFKCRNIHWGEGGTAAWDGMNIFGLRGGSLDFGLSICQGWTSDFSSTFLFL